MSLRFSGNCDLILPIRRTILDELTGTVRSMLAREVPERVLFMTGEAGIGKSTLIKQLIAELESDSKPPIVAIAECSTPVAGSGVGYVEALKPFADIMAGLVEAGSGAAGLGSAQTKRPGFKLDIGKFFVDTAPSWIGLIPVIGAPIFHALSIVGSGYDQVYLHKKLHAEGASAASNQEQVFRQYINFITKLTDEVPVLIVLDDFHWADTSSTNLLFAAARDLVSCQVVFLVVYREDDIRRSASQEEHPILHVRNEIERYSMSRAIEISPADQADLRALIQSAYPDYTPSDALEQWLLRITDGNLLFATQFLSTLEHDEYLEPKTAVLLKDPATVPVPSSANAVVVEHIRRLTDDDKEHLRYASVEGETITAHMVSRFLDIPMIKMLQRLRVLEERHHVIRSLGEQSLYATETSAYQFVHFLVHKSLYEDLGKAERAILHGIAADVLEEELATAEEAHHNVHVVAARLAAHATIAGRHQTAAEAYLKGARWVWKSFSADEALYLLEQCLHLVEAQKNPSTAMFSVGVDARLLKAYISRHRGRYSEAYNCFEEVIQLANKKGAGTPAQHSEAYVGRASMKEIKGEFLEAEADARVALQIAIASDDVNSRIRALGTIGNTLDSRSRFDEALDYYQQSLNAAMSVGDDTSRAVALARIGNVYYKRGQSAPALEHHTQALALHRSLQDVTGIIMDLSNSGNVLADLGQFDLVMERYEEALTLARSSGSLRQEAIIMNNMANELRRLGRFDEALDLANRSLALKEGLGDRSGVAYTFSLLGNIYKDMNLLDNAMKYLTLSLEIATDIQDQFMAAKTRTVIAWIHLLLNDPSEALSQFNLVKHDIAELGIPDPHIEISLGSVCCALKLDANENNGPTIVSAIAVLARTRALVPVEDFTVDAYECILAECLGDIHKLGLTFEA